MTIQWKAIKEMTIRSVEYLQCDAPQCPAEAVFTERPAMPEGWTWLWSTAHIPEGIRGDRRRLSTVDRCYGGFRLSLCPQHPNAFDGHRPTTDAGAGQRGRPGVVMVGCECGAKLGWTAAESIVGEKPSHSPERFWWRHLPAELRWYARRGQA